MYRLGLLGVVSACGFGAPAGTDGVTDAGRDAPPMIDARGPSDDVDNDGVVNASDNCPEHGNAKQFDEDSDGAGDECDPCPQIADEPVDDGDGDGIANICDPHPEIRDVRVRFDGFHEGPGLPDGWTKIAGDDSATVMNGALVATADDGPNIFRVDAGGPQHSIDIGFRLVDSSVGGDNISAVSALADVSEDGTTFFLCGLRLDAPSKRDLWRFIPGNAMDLQEVNANIPTATDYAIRLSSQPSGPACEVMFPGSSSLLSSPTAPTPNSYVAFRVRNADVQVRYVAVYRH